MPAVVQKSFQCSDAGQTSLKRLGAGLCCAALLTMQPATAAQVQWSNGLISVSASGQPLSAVLRDIAAVTGTTIQGADALSAPVNGELHRMALVEALRWLLAGQNFLIIEGGRHSATRVIVVDDPTRRARAGMALAAPAASRPATALAADPQLDRALEDVDPAVRIEAVERLGDRGDERSLALVRQALSDPMEAVRAAARQVLATRH